MRALKRLFSLMIGSDLSFANPKEVLDNLYDDSGTKIEFGEQKDIVEFYDQFHSSLEEAWKFDVNFKKQNIQIQSINLDKSKQNELDLIRGKINSLITVSDPQTGSNKLLSTNQESFNPILINIRDKNLMNALKNRFKYKIENLSFKGQTYNAIKEEWIIQYPKIMIMQIARAQYNPETQSFSKNNSKFFFDKYFFIDQFLEQNMDLIKNSKHKQIVIDKRIEELDKEI